MNKAISLLLFFSIIYNCQAQQKETRARHEARQAIEASNLIYAELANKGGESILTRYTDDACLLPPNAPPVCGKENIANFFKDGPKVQVRFTIQHLYGDASMFVTEESFYEMRDMNGNLIDEGKVVVVWKKTSDGWKMHRDMFSSNKGK